ncbi:MAG: hypothetical protein IAE81_06435 [Caldilineaceae bacterium]|jgi:hypothetical protein|nr:hypothetical protein [Caldilineaceae bacterium]
MPLGMTAPAGDFSTLSITDQSRCSPVAVVAVPAIRQTPAAFGFTSWA